MLKLICQIMQQKQISKVFLSHLDTSRFALKTNLVSLKTEVDTLDFDKLVPALVNLSKLSNVVKNDVVKKNVYDKSVTKVNNIDTGGFILKTKYDGDKSEIEKKIPDTIRLVKKQITIKLLK